MLDRRHVLGGGLAAFGSLSVSSRALAQTRPPVKIRYNEVVRSILYAPAYVAITNGYFKDAGLDVSLTTAQGGDKAVAALLSNSADIALMGPEAAIYAQNSESPTKTPIFCGLTSTDGFMLMRIFSPVFTAATCARRSPIARSGMRTFMRMTRRISSFGSPFFHALTIGICRPSE